MMSADPGLFDAYHTGFRSQVKSWPRNPLDTIIAELSRAARGQVVADFGCGEARLAATLGSGPSPHCARVHSFDLAAPPGNAQGVTVCNMAKVPLPPASCHASVFCLSLMGTDYWAFLKEGVRVLRPGGRLLVAEIRSRFEGGASSGGGGGASAQGGRKRQRAEEEGEGEGREDRGGADRPLSGLPAFIDAVSDLGCTLEKRDEKNKMFVFLSFVKHSSGSGDAAEGAHKGALPSGSRGVGGGAKAGKKKQRLQGASSGGGGGGGSGYGSHPLTGPALKPCRYKKR